jgi:ATP-dependent helicase/nuclease subunit A
LALVGKSVHTLAELTRDYANAYSAKKQEQGLLDFSDIEHLALQILVDPETKEPTLVAKEFQGQFEEVMIDEYQDSNYVQEAILSAVSGGGGRNNRFMVGDVKQSIYRFRLARPELFMEKYDTYGTEDGDCQKICLDKNFRSRPQVLDSVNDLFYRIMKRDLGGVAYDEAAALYPGADYPKGADGAYRTRILLADAQPQAMAEQGFDDSKQLEAALIAEEITHLMENGQVSDGAGGFRRVRYSDIVILLRSLSWADELVEQLSARDIPSHRTSQTGYFGTSEVQTILSLCQVIDNPLQDIPLAAVLRSSFCSFSNEELALLRLAGEHDFFYGHIREYADAGEDAPLREKCAAFLEWLSLWRERARHLSVHDLLDELLRESGYLNILRAYPAGEKRLANVEQLLLLAANFERSGYKGLFSFIRYMEQLQKYQVDFGEADVTDEQADVVRIMSIHKSKGLEFPVVFVSGLGRKFNKKDSTDEMIFDSTYGVGLTLVEGEKRRKRTTLLKQMIAARIAGDNMGEELRVLYVALTRAKEQLILTGTARDLEKTLLNYELQSETDASYLDRREAGCYLDWIMPGAYRHPEHLSIETFEPQELTLLEQLHEKEIFLEREALLDGLEPVDAELYRQIAERMDSTYAWQEEVSLKTKVSVSELKRRNMILEPGDAQTLAWYAKEQEPGAYSGALRGTAMHRVMECLDYGRLSGANADSVKGQLDELVEQGRISEEMAALVNTWKIGQFLQTGLAKRIMQAHNKGMLYREQPFVMGIPANEADPEVQSEELVLVQGIIDLYFEEPDGLVLLDYKTDSVKTAGQLLDRYQTQMDLYARALAAATGKPVKEKIIYSFKLEEMIYA